MAKRTKKLVIKHRAVGGMQKGRLKGATKAGAGERWKRGRKR